MGVTGGCRRTEGRVVYVDAANGGPWDGRSWATAFRGIHEGLDAAEALVAGADARPQVWVARGIYKPSARGDRDAAFRLRRGVDLFGGFRATRRRRSSAIGGRTRRC